MKASRWLKAAVVAASGLILATGATHLSCSGDRPPLVGELDASADANRTAAPPSPAPPPSFAPEPGSNRGGQESEDNLGEGIPENQEPSGEGNVPIGRGDVPAGDPILPGDPGSNQPILPGEPAGEQPGGLPGEPTGQEPGLPREEGEPATPPPRQDEDGTGGASDQGGFTFPGGRFDPGSGVIIPPGRDAGTDSSAVREP